MLDNNFSVVEEVGAARKVNGVAGVADHKLSAANLDRNVFVHLAPAVQHGGKDDPV